jgi:hypothetical protein
VTVPPRHETPVPATRSGLWWALGVFVTMRTALALLSSGPIPQSDSPMYLPVPHDRFGQVDVLGSDPRPWVVTLPYALLENLKAIVIAQEGFSLVCWCVLLVAVWQLPFRSAVGRWAAIGTVTAIGLDATTTYWDYFLLSESAAMSGAVLFVAGALLVLGSRLRWFGMAASGAGLLIVASIRPATLVPTIGVIVVLAFTVSASWRRHDSRNVIVPAVAASLLSLVAVYVTVINARMDTAWGRDFIASPAVHGRTLQQVGVINLTPWGHAAILEVSLAGHYDCMEKYYASPPPDGNFWRVNLMSTCPREAAPFSRTFQSSYVSWLLRHPRLTVRELSAPFNESFTAVDDPNNISLIPADLTALWAPTAPTGRNPVVLWTLLLVVGSVALRRSGMTRCPEVLLLSVMATAGLAAVVANVAFSPLDALRVSSAPAMLTRLSAIIGLVLVIDLLVSRRRQLLRDRRGAFSRASDGARPAVATRGADPAEPARESGHDES